jgi:RsiW-degrading membrane proteinase PrsW (M82 family)
MRAKKIFHTGILNILFQAVFLFVIYLIGHRSSLDVGENLRLVILVCIVLVPSFIWAVFYYLQDRENPEPFFYILTCFISGMAAAGLFALPLFLSVFRISDWLYSSTLLFTLGSFFVMAAVACVFMYLIIRYLFYPLREFDEPVDGMIYGAIAGAGFAFVLSLYYLAQRPEYTLFSMAYTASINILIYSAVGSKLGDILGRARFQKKNTDRRVFFGLLAAILLLGIYHLLNEFIFLTGFSQAIWVSFALTLLYSLFIILFCYFQIYRLSKEEYPLGKKEITSLDPMTTVLIAALLVVAVVLSLLGQRGERFHHEEYGLTFRFPHMLSPFVSTETPSSALSILQKSEILFSAESWDPKYVFFVKTFRREKGESEVDYMRYVDVSDTASLNIREEQKAGKKWTRIAYSYIDTPLASEEEFPVLYKVYSDVFFRQNRVFIFLFKAPSRSFDEGLKPFERILKTVSWEQR